MPASPGPAIPSPPNRTGPAGMGQGWHGADAGRHPEVALVVARAENGVIGRDNGLPWRLPADLRRFRRLTIGKPVVMGRRTFESIGKPLPGRHNIVLTRRVRWQADGVTVVPSFAEALAAAGLDPDMQADSLMVIGGAGVFAEAMPLASRIELTEVHACPLGDTWFEAPDPALWVEVARESHPAEGDAPAFSFVRLERRRTALAA